MTIREEYLLNVIKKLLPGLGYAGAETWPVKAEAQAALGHLIIHENQGDSYPARPTFRQWMLDMTGPEDAWARDQYGELVGAVKTLLSEMESKVRYGGDAFDPDPRPVEKALTVCGEL